MPGRCATALCTRPASVRGRTGNAWTASPGRRSSRRPGSPWSRGVPVGRGHMPERRARPDHASLPAMSRSAPGVPVQPGAYELDEQKVDDAVDGGGGTDLRLCEFRSEKFGGPSELCVLAGCDVQRPGEGGKHRCAHLRVLLVVQDDHFRLHRRRAQPEGPAVAKRPGRRRTVAGTHRHAGAAGYPVCGARRHQDGVSGLHLKGFLAWDVEPHGAAGHHVQCRSWSGVQPQAPGSSGLQHDPERPTRTRNTQDLRQHIHGSILVHRRAPPTDGRGRMCPRPQLQATSRTTFPCTFRANSAWTASSTFCQPPRSPTGAESLPAAMRPSRSVSSPPVGVMSP